MDRLPAPLPYLGSLVRIFVLMSASAASAQGLQNLALGLKERHYIPPAFGEVNGYEVADKPVWLEVGIVCVCFLLFGTREETYLTLYAAGVFILLSMTGWAVTKRLFREMSQKLSLRKAGLIAGTIVAAMLTTGATLVIFEERFLEGAWAYFLFIPVLYAVSLIFDAKSVRLRPRWIILAISIPICWQVLALGKRQCRDWVQKMGRRFHLSWGGCLSRS